MKKSISPKLIAQFNKNASEIVKVQLTEYDGRQLLDVRVWVLKNEKDYIPTKKGISLRLEQVGALRDAIVKAAKEIKSGKQEGPKRAKQIYDKVYRKRG